MTLLYSDVSRKIYSRRQPLASVVFLRSHLIRVLLPHAIALHFHCLTRSGSQLLIQARVSGLIRATDDEADAASKEEPAEAAQTGETGDKVKVESGSETSTTSPTAISGGGSVADELAGMMWSPWRTPPAMTVDLQPLREMRRLMIQVITLVQTILHTVLPARIISFVEIYVYYMYKLYVV